MGIHSPNWLLIYVNIELICWPSTFANAVRLLSCSLLWLVLLDKDEFFIVIKPFAYCICTHSKLDQGMPTEWASWFCLSLQLHFPQRSYRLYFFTRLWKRLKRKCWRSASYWLLLSILSKKIMCVDTSAKCNKLNKWNKNQQIQQKRPTTPVFATRCPQRVHALRRPQQQELYLADRGDPWAKTSRTEVFHFRFGVPRRMLVRQRQGNFVLFKTMRLLLLHFLVQWFTWLSSYRSFPPSANSMPVQGVKQLQQLEQGVDGLNSEKAGILIWENVLTEDERKDLWYMCEIGYAMLYGSETWGEWGVNSEVNWEIYGKSNVWREDWWTKRTLMNMRGLRETVEKLAKASRVRWYGHVLRRDEDDAQRKALSIKLEGQRKKGRPRKTWRRQVEKVIGGIGLREEDAFDRARWRNGIKLIHGRNEVNPASAVKWSRNRIKTRILLLIHF